MKKLKTLAIAAATAAGALTLAVPARAATTIVCRDRADGKCTFDGDRGRWEKLIVREGQTATTIFKLALNTWGKLDVKISRHHLEVVSISFNEIIIEEDRSSFSFLVNPHAGPEALKIVMKNNSDENLGFTGTLRFIASPVPEPAAWGLMIAGFGMAGGALRRRRWPRVAVA